MKYTLVDIIGGIYIFLNREYLPHIQNIDSHVEIMNNGISIEGYSINFKVTLDDPHCINPGVINAYFKQLDTKIKEKDNSSLFRYSLKVIGNLLIFQLYFP